MEDWSVHFQACFGRLAEMPQDYFVGHNQVSQGLFLPQCYMLKK
jgi:hypothetical protein